MQTIAAILLNLALLAAATGAAALDAAAIIAAAPPASAFPDDDVVVLYRAETVTVTADGLVTRRVHTLQRLQTQWAMRQRSDVRVAWDDRRQQLEVTTARTFMRDGTVVVTPDNGYNEVTPGAVSRAAPFLNWRELVISHVGTEPGCVVELAYELRDRAAGPLPPSGLGWLGQEDPVLESRFTVTGAAARLVTAGADEVVASDGSFTAHDLPAYRPEGPASLRHRWVPHVVWGQLDGPADLTRALRRRHREARSSGDPLAAWLAATRDDPEVLTDGDLLRRVAALVHDETAAVHLPGGTWSAAPRPTGEVFATAVGTDWERALLAAALLREAGWQPEIGVFGQASVVENQLLAAEQLDHLRVVVRLGDENWWLAPERAEPWSGRNDLAGWSGVFLGADGSDRVYTVAEQPGRCRLSARLAPGEDEGWTAVADLVLAGPYRPRGQDARELAEALAGRILREGELGELEVREEASERLALRLTASGAGPGETVQGLLVCELPWPEHGVLAHLPTGFHLERPQRQSPLWIETSGREELSLRIELPAGWRRDAPAAAELELNCAAASFRRQIREEDGTLTIEAMLELGAGPVAPQELGALREVLVAARTARREPLVLIESE